MLRAVLVCTICAVSDSARLFDDENESRVIGTNAEDQAFRFKRSLNLMRKFVITGTSQLRGKLAMAHLLKDTERIPSPRGKAYTVFKKSGGITRAEKDFYSVKPTDLHVNTMMRAAGDWSIISGRTGDRTIYLHSWDPKYRQPVITVTRDYSPGNTETWSKVTDVIRYEE